LIKGDWSSDVYSSDLSISFGGVTVVTKRLEGVEDKQLREVSDRLRDGAGAGVVLLASVSGDKVNFVVSIQKALTERGWHAGHIAKEFAALIQGSGGGRPDFAQGGGKDVAALDKALSEVESILKRLVIKTHG
jgi:alanyl-tRNA synthetase